MRNRDYQREFAGSHPAMYQTEGRQRKADTLVAVLQAELGEGLKGARVLTVGCSTGIMDSYIAPQVGMCVGMDIDERAIKYANDNFARPNLSFQVGDAMATGMPANSFDVVICSQVYEHVPDPTRMMGEILRVLAPGGVCYFAATNRLCIVEQHYFLPFLSIIPVRMANVYLRLARKGDHYYERHKTWWGLRRLVARFQVEDYTRRILADPDRYHAGYMFNTIAKLRIARALAWIAYWAFPGYIWVLRRPE